MKKIIVLTSLTLFTFTLFAQDKQKAEVEKVLTEFRQAILDGDSATLDKLTAAELTYGHSLGKLETKQQFIHALASGESDYKSLDVTNQSIMVKDDIAIVRHTITADITDAGKYNKVTLVVLLVFHKEKKQWKLIARQAIRPPAQS